MARMFTVFMPRSRIPDRPALQAAIRALSLPLKLEEEFAPSATSAYLPCTLDGEDAGFTLRLDGNAEIADEKAALILQWGGDPREKVAALMVAAALAQAFGAMVKDEKAATTSAQELLALARRAHADLS